MNTAQWMACSDPWEMLEFLEPRASDRKLQLFAVACCRRAWHLSDDRRHQELVDAAERFAEGMLGEEAFEAARDAVMELPDEEKPWSLSRYMTAATLHAKGGGSAKYAARFAARGLALRLASEESGPRRLAALEAEETTQCALLRDIFGDPSRPFRFPPDWLSREGQRAAELAREIAASGRYDDLSTLADALERAGCDDRAVLDHCRAPGVHVHGCWVIDALLGRETAVLVGLITEADWRTCGDPAPLLDFLRDRGTERQWRLFAVACCRRIEPLIADEPCRRAIDVAARYADGAATDEERRAARAAAWEVYREAKAAEYAAEAQENFCVTPRYATFGRRLFATQAALETVGRDPRAPEAEPGTYEADYWRPSHEWVLAALHYHVYERMDSHDPDGWQAEPVKQAVAMVDAAEQKAQCDLLRDLFGEHFGPLGNETAWLPWRGNAQEAWCILPCSRGGE